MSRSWKLCLLVVIILITAFAFAENGGQLQSATVNVTAGQPATAAAAVPETPAVQPAQPAPKPGLAITFGVEEKFRWDGYNNNDFNGAKHDQKAALSLRTRPWLNIPLGQNIDAFIRMGNLATKVTTDPTTTVETFGTTKVIEGNERPTPFFDGETWIDNAYFNFKKLPYGFSAKIGRQDLVRGEGFVFTDPSGGDGPRSGFTNAAIIAKQQGRTLIEAIGLYNPKFDEFFPVISPFQGKATSTFVCPPQNGGGCGTVAGVVSDHSGKQLSEQDVLTGGLYVTNKSLRNTDLEVYGMFNKQYNDLRSRASYQYLPDMHYFMPGARITQRLPMLSKNLWITAEFNGEIGSEDSMSPTIANFPMRAMAGYVYATKKFNAKFHPWVRGGYWGVSGQTPGSSTYGGYQWANDRMPHGVYMDGPDGPPNWAQGYETYAQQAYEFGGTTVQVQNQNFWMIDGGFSPIKQIMIQPAYYQIGAYEPFSFNPYHTALDNPLTTAAAASAMAPFVGATGLSRAKVPTLQLTFKINPKFFGYVRFEKQFAGNFLAPVVGSAAGSCTASTYVPGAICGGQSLRNNGWWGRVEINYNFNGSVPFKKIT